VVQLYRALGGREAIVGGGVSGTTVPVSVRSMPGS